MNTITTSPGVNTITRSSGMNTITRNPIDIKILGFSARERLLLASIFRVSNTYREWQEDQKARPDCILLDADDDEGCKICQQFVHPGGPPVVAIGVKKADKIPVTTQLRRPFRAAEVLSTLDSLLQPQQDLLGANTNPPSASRKASSIRAEFDGTEQSARKFFRTVPAVLVVNPYPVGWRYITAKSAAHGYRVDHVSSGAGAMSLLSKHRYNCVVLETYLPDKDAFEICKRIKRSHDRRKVPVIIVTSSRNPLDRIRAQLVGCDAFLSKPVKPEQLDLLLEEYLPAYTMR